MDQKSKIKSKKKEIRECKYLADKLFYTEAAKYNTPISNALLAAFKKKKEEVILLETEKDIEFSKGLSFLETLKSMNDALVLPKNQIKKLNPGIRTKIKELDHVNDKSSIYLKLSDFITMFLEVGNKQDSSYQLQLYQIGSSNGLFGAVVFFNSGKDYQFDSMSDSAIKKMRDFLDKRTKLVLYNVSNTVGIHFKTEN